MEFIAVDISIIVITLIAATVIILLYSFSSGALYFCRYCVEDFAVIDIVHTLKKLCPVSFGSKWRLLPLYLGLSRCWTKKVLLPGFQNCINLYGVACAVTCSSVYAFSLIADVSKWGEWEPLPSSQGLLLKPFSDSKLQEDDFMQADQVVGIQKGTDAQSYIAMYRFMSFPERTVKWILFWNAKNLEFMFFLIQPAVSKTVDNQCLITHIFGSLQYSPHVATIAAQRLKNVKEFLLLSQLHIIASNCAPAVPAVAVSRIHPDLLKTQSPKESRSRVLPELSGYQHTYMLVPIAHSIQHIYKGLKGFDLIVKDDVKGEKQLIYKAGISQPFHEPNDPLRRIMSETDIEAKQNPNVNSSLHPSPGKGNTKITKSSDLKHNNSIIVAEGFNIESQEKDSDHRQTRWYTDPCVSTNREKRISSSHSDGSEMHTDEETYVNLHIIHEDASEENDAPLSSYDKNDIFCSSTSEFEMLDLNQKFLDCKIADFLTQGNYGASELQAEMMLASQLDKSLSPEEQSSSGGWVYHSSYKGIPVLSKTTAGQFMKILSFLCQMEIPAACQDVWKCVKNPRFRFICDETVKAVKIIERISNSQKLIHVYHETNGIIRKEAVDFCLLQTEREEANHFYSSFHSMEYEKCPFMTSVIRGSLRPSGWVVESLGLQKCKVTHLMQILVSSPDSLFINDLSSLVPLAMYSLKNYIALQPK